MGNCSVLLQQVCKIQMLLVLQQRHLGNVHWRKENTQISHKLLDTDSKFVIISRDTEWYKTPP